MDETIAAVHEVRAAGLPVIGYTWFPLITMVDWAYRTSALPLSDHLLHLGLWDSHFDERGVLVRDRSYEIPGCVRLTIGTRAQILRFLEELESLWTQ